MENTTALQKNAYFISAITHPLLVPVAGFIILNKYSPASFHGQSFYILVLVFILTVIGIPAYLVYALKRSGYIKSYEMETLEERRLPLLFSSATLLFTYYLMRRSALPEPFPIYFLSASVAALLATGISLFYKISLHTIGIGFLFGLGIALSYFNDFDMRWYLIIISVIAGIIGYSRLYLKAHSPAQLYWGFIGGACCAAGMVLFI